jgi:hypothetical protein
MKTDFLTHLLFFSTVLVQSASSRRFPEIDERRSGQGLSAHLSHERLIRSRYLPEGISGKKGGSKNTTSENDEESGNEGKGAGAESGGTTKSTKASMKHKSMKHHGSSKAKGKESKKKKHLFEEAEEKKTRKGSSNKHKTKLGKGGHGKGESEPHSPTESPSHIVGEWRVACLGVQMNLLLPSSLLHVR